jgi:hypothetical protein
MVKRKSRSRSRRRKSPRLKSRKRSGMIYRKGYVRKGYTRKDGTRVKSVRVKGGWIRSTSPYKGKRSAWEKRVVSRTRRRQSQAAKKTRGRGATKCRSGYIRRSPYMRKTYRRKAYTRKDGTRVKAVTVKRSAVPSKCIRDRGRPGKGPVRIGPLRKGTLSKYGYSTSKSAQARHTALSKAVKADSALSVFRKLNAVMVLTKNTSPTASAKFRADRNWVKKKYGV